MDPNEPFEPTEQPEHPNAEEPVSETSADDQAGASQDEAAATDEPAHDQRTRRLERRPDERIISGVAAGIADYFGLDVSLVRVGFVILSLFGGFGVVLYAAGWVLMPEPGHTPPATEFLNASKWRKLALFLVAIGVGIVTLRVIASGPWGFSWRAGRDLAWLVVVAVIGLLLLRGARPAVGRGRVLRRTGVFGLVLVLLVLAATICTEVVSGVPLRGGIGSRNLRPTSIHQLVPTYRAAVGNMTLDLSDVTFPDHAVDLTASIGIGHLVIDVPTGVRVSVSAHTGIGDVVYGPGGLASFVSGANSGSTASSGQVLVIDASAGIGQVDLDRVPALTSDPVSV